jgi:hypothetical protein
MTFLSDAQILDPLPGLGQRADDFSFELLGPGRASLGFLNVVADTQTPSVQLDTTRTSFRLMNGVEVVATDLSQIDLFNDRVRPWMTLQNGSRYPLGVFMFGEQVENPYSWGTVWTPSLFDETFIVDQAMSRPVSLPIDSSVLKLYQQLTDELNLPDVSYSVEDVQATSPVTWKVGESRYVILKALATLLGCFPPHFTNAGTFMLRTFPAVGDTSVDHVYDVGTRILDGTSQIVSDAYLAPNQWIVIGDSTTTPIIGIYNLPDSAPASAANRGFVVTAPPISLPGLKYAPWADVIARNAALTDTTAYGKGKFEGTADPRHEVFDTISLFGLRYLETGWQLQCTSGGTHQHSMQRIYD